MKRTQFLHIRKFWMTFRHSVEIPSKQLARSLELWSELQIQIWEPWIKLRSPKALACTEKEKPQGLSIGHSSTKGLRSWELPQARELKNDQWSERETKAGYAGNQSSGKSRKERPVLTEKDRMLMVTTSTSMNCLPHHLSIHSKPGDFLGLFATNMIQHEATWKSPGTILSCFSTSCHLRKYVTQYL